MDQEFQLVTTLTRSGLAARYAGGSGQGVRIDINDLRENVRIDQIPGLVSKLAPYAAREGFQVVNLQRLGHTFSGPEGATIGGHVIDVTLAIYVVGGEVTILGGTWSQSYPDTYDLLPLVASNRSIPGNFGNVILNIFEHAFPPTAAFARPFPIDIAGTRELVGGNVPAAFLAECFPSGTRVQGGRCLDRNIEDLRPGDVIAAFDGTSFGGRGGLVEKQVTRTFESITETWVKLRWQERGEARELTVTPGHHFLDSRGGFRPIDAILADDGVIVLEDGSHSKVTGEYIHYSADTADLFEQAEGYVTLTVAGLALAPVYRKGWKTYNFEVEDLHTYVAGGHYASLWKRQSGGFIAAGAGAAAAAAE